MTIHSRKIALKPYAIQSPSDQPNNHILTDASSGRSIFLTAQEKTLIQRLNGSTIESLVQSIFHLKQKPLTTLGKLLHDLDHFGFLVNAPCEDETSAHGSNVTPAPLEPRINPALKLIGAAVASKFLFIVLCLLILATFTAFFISSPLLRFLQIEGSTAWGACIASFSAFVFLWLVAWIQSVSLSACVNRPIPLGCVFPIGLPVPSFDASASFILPRRQRTRIILFPVLRLLSAVGLFLWITTLPLTVFWKDVATQLALGAWLGLLMYSSPWFESPYSSLARPGFRKRSLTALLYDSLRSLFGYLFVGANNKGESTHFVIWGVWTLLWPLLVVRTFAALFKNDIPRLLGRLTQESGSPGWWAALFVAAFISVGAVFAVASTLIFFIRGAIKNLTMRWRPQQTHILLFMLFALIAAVTCRISFLPPIILPAAQSITQAVLGLAIIFFSLKFTSSQWIQQNAWPWLGVGLLGAAHIAAALNSPFNYTLYAWCAVALGIVISAQRQGRFAQALLISALVISVIYFSFLDQISFQYLRLPLFIIILLQFCLSITSRERLIWGWLSVAFLLDSYSSLLPFENELSPWVGYLSQSALCIAILAKSSIYDLRLDDWRPYAISRPLDRLNYCVHQATGARINLPSADDEMKSILAIKKQIGPHAWRCVFKHWLPTLTWKEIQTEPTLMQEIRLISGDVQLNEKTILEAFLHVPCLRGFDLDRKHLNAIVRVWVADEGDILIRQDSDDDALAVILSGRVRIENNHSFVSSHTVAYLSEGAFFGEVSFLTTEPRTATVRASQPFLAVALRRRDVKNECPLLEKHLKQTSEERQWSQLLASLPLFNEMSPSLFLRAVLQTHLHELNPGESLNWEGGVEGSLGVVVKGEAKIGEEIYRSCEWIGFETLYSGNTDSYTIQAVSDAQIAITSRELIQEAVEEILLQEQLTSL
ncbi:MAG: cyclic nucleotide-binding domain-containing protein [Candidatus Hinthialibacter antarcticus]|nr:cyclic nucleotide-binding domain-containing protein [Candidatus Hinthialibacter antarcticus]